LISRLPKEIKRKKEEVKVVRHDFDMVVKKKKKKKKKKKIKKN
jgi:hypothetical protein